MSDLIVDPGPGLPDGLIIPAADLVERFARSSGPGGQGVNTTDSKVQLALDLTSTNALDETQRRRALSHLRNRLSEGVLMVESSGQRSQIRNRADARQRMAALLREALAPPPPTRRATRPTRGSVERRLAAKRRRSQIKAARGRQSDA